MKKTKNKQLTVRLSDKIYNKIIKKANKENRSLNYIVVKMIEEKIPRFDNDIYLSENILKEMKDFCNKSNMSIEELIEQLWKAYRKTYRQ